MNIYEQDLGRDAANFVPLSPVSFVERSGEVFADLEAVVHGSRRQTWQQTRERSARLAAALRALGVGRGTTVSAMLHNTPEMVEAHYAVPALNAVLNTLNTRLDAALLAWQMNHCECAVLLTDRELAPTMGPALRILRDEHGRTPVVIDVCDSEYTGPGERIGTHEYEALLAAHEPLPRLEGPGDEWDAIAVSYTSGTTGDPKGVVTHHRGAYLNAVCNAATWNMPNFRATCGPCRCSIATAGASLGRWPCSAARTSACARWRRRRSSTPCARRGSTTTAARPSSTTC
jgi:fatty-acyl-CoA synthase